MATPAVFMEAVCVEDEATRSIAEAAAKAAGEAAREAVKGVAGAAAGEAAGEVATEAATKAAQEAAEEVLLEASKEAAEAVQESRTAERTGGGTKLCEASQPPASASEHHRQARPGFTRHLVLVKLCPREGQGQGRGIKAWASDLQTCAWTGELDESQLKAQVQSDRAISCLRQFGFAVLLGR